MPGICVAVKATTLVFPSSRKTTLKSWKSRPPAPMMMTLRTIDSFRRRSAPTAIDLGDPQVPDPVGCPRLDEVALAPAGDRATDRRLVGEPTALGIRFRRGDQHEVRARRGVEIFEHDVRPAGDDA